MHKNAIDIVIILRSEIYECLIDLFLSRSNKHNSLFSAAASFLWYNIINDKSSIYKNPTPSSIRNENEEEGEKIRISDN